MAPYLRKLVIAAFAILAFAAGNFAMVSSGMAHGDDASGHHLTTVACESAHDLTISSHADEHRCEPAPEGMCGDGATCCSSACQVLMLVSEFSSFRQKVELVEPSLVAGSFASTSTFLDRPPRA